MHFQSLKIPILAICALAWNAGAAEFAITANQTTISFTERDHQVALRGITDRNGKTNYLLANAPGTALWKLEFRPPGGDEKQAVFLSPDALAASPEIAYDSGARLTLVWRNLALGSTGTSSSLAERNAVDVTICVSKTGHSSLTDWRINVENRSKRLGLWTVTFPNVEGLSVGPKGMLATPLATGQIFEDPVMSNGYAGSYPHALCSMQFMSLFENGSCLYLATHDPHAYVKGMEVASVKDRAKGLTYRLTQYPENMGVPGTGYNQPYPCLIGTLDGDWVDAAKLYRKWVLAESDWMKGKASIAKRQDWPDWFKRLPFWFGFHGMTDENMEKTKALVTYLDVPVAAHLYHWHQIPYDTKYPDFWPPHDSTFTYAKDLQSLGVKVMPYINCRLIDQGSDSWKNDGAGKYVALLPGHQTSDELWSAGGDVKLSVVCPATAYWQEKYLPLTRRLVDELKVDGIYCDQVACVDPVLCFDPRHGHPLGGGDHWVAGYAKMIANIRTEAEKKGKFVFLTTESAAEPYDFDIFLRCNEGAPFLSPIWMTVYAGYRASFGFYFYTPEEWVPKLATQYLWGIQIGWAGAHAPAENPGNAAFEREVARARYAGSAYLAMGEMLREPKLEGDFERLKATWQNFGTKIPIDWPAVKGSLWRAEDGSLGLALVNMCGKPQTVTVTLSRHQAGFDGGPVTVKSIYPANLLGTTVLTGNDLRCKITLPPMSASIVSLTPAAGKEARTDLK
jgi:hypothetical protein